MRNLIFQISEAQRSFRNKVFDYVEAQRNCRTAFSYHANAQPIEISQHSANNTILVILLKKRKQFAKEGRHLSKYYDRIGTKLNSMDVELCSPLHTIDKIW